MPVRTNTTAVVGRILIYPVKSLDPVSVSAATILASGALEGDREFALVDDSGGWINAKREARIHRIRAQFDLPGKRVTLGVSPDRPMETFHLIEDRARLEDWFTAFFGFRARLERNPAGGFPDDTESPGPTIIGSASLRAVADWFGLDLEEARRRFRANIELDADAPFWEDRLFSESGDPLEFRLGSVVISGVNPCQRCAVPSRDSQTGDLLPEFQRVFAGRRAELLPHWAPRSRFNHYYRLSVNTRISASEAGKPIRVGDAVTQADPS
jgi:uncharacterized protein YcbX